MAIPEGARIIRGDGTVLYPELVHLGVDEEGIDQWEVAGAVWNPADGDRFELDLLPSDTMLHVRSSTIPQGSWTYEDSDGNTHTRDASELVVTERQSWWRCLLDWLSSKGI